MRVVGTILLVAPTTCVRLLEYLASTTSKRRGRCAAPDTGRPLLWILAALALGGAGCGSPSAPAGTPATLTISTAPALTTLGQTYQLTATAAFGDRTSRDVTGETQWTSRDPSIATVSAGGLVTAVGLGSVTVSATFQSLSVTRLIAVTPMIIGLSVTGNRSLTAIGETSQLRAIVSLAGGGSADMTDVVSWVLMTTPSVVGLSKGLVTAVGFGWTQVNVSYPPFAAANQVTVTPPGTYYIKGFVRLPGHAGVPGVQVLDMQSGRSMVSTSTGAYGPGWYTLGALVGSTRLTFDKAGYEPAELVVSGSIDAGNDVRVQQLYRITAGDTVNRAGIVGGQIP